MKPLYLHSEDALYEYLRKFLRGKNRAAQLDGSPTSTPNPAVFIVFRYSVDGCRYKLSGDLPRRAVERFVRLADEHGSPAVVLKEHKFALGPGLTLAIGGDSEGFRCLRFAEKSSRRLDQAA